MKILSLAKKNLFTGCSESWILQKMSGLLSERCLCLYLRVGRRHVRSVQLSSCCDWELKHRLGSSRVFGRRLAVPFGCLPISLLFADLMGVGLGGMELPGTLLSLSPWLLGLVAAGNWDTAVGNSVFFQNAHVKSFISPLHSTGMKHQHG